MYTPKFNQVTDRAVLLEAMQTYSFAILIGPQAASHDAGSETIAPIVATHLPLVVKDEGPHGLIEGHFAMANRHWQSLAGRETLVIFPGPHSYVSPAFYVEEKSVPTWNYIAVHAYGTLTLVEDSEEKEALLQGLDQNPRARRLRSLALDERQLSQIDAGRNRSASAFLLRASRANSKSARTACPKSAPT